MANELLDITKVASGAVTANAVVVLDANGKCLLPGAVNAAKAIGVAGHAGAIGDNIRVRVAGIAEVVAAAAIVPGDYLMIADNTGKVTPVLAVAGTVYNIVGIALEAAGASGDIIEMLIAFATRNSAVS